MTEETPQRDEPDSADVQPDEHVLPAATKERHTPARAGKQPVYGSRDDFERRWSNKAER
jgi:hypothetical protein